MNEPTHGVPMFHPIWETTPEQKAARLSQRESVRALEDRLRTLTYATEPPTPPAILSDARERLRVARLKLWSMPGTPRD